MPIQLKLTGFEDLLKDIEKADGSMIKAVDSTMRQSAQTMQSELKTQMKSAGVPADLINALPPPDIRRDRNSVSASVGYYKGAYNPKELSDGYKVLFLNYGTPNRSKHGKVVARGFVKIAKRKASPKIKKQQQETLKKILGRLGK